MAKQVVVTIGRQFGSGGHEIGNLLAERLDIPLYDRETWDSGGHCSNSGRDNTE